jgi:hypothetical protein
VSRNLFCDFLADPDSRSFSRFGAIIMQVAVHTVEKWNRGTEPLPHPSTSINQ